MKKFLVTIEFRYADAPKDNLSSTSKSRTITIGVYDTFDDACQNGNKLLENIESKFTLNPYTKGSNLKERFSSRRDLITSYLKTPFEFYAKIKTLEYDQIDNVIDDVVNSVKRYRLYEKQLDE